MAKLQKPIAKTLLKVNPIKRTPKSTKSVNLKKTVDQVKHKNNELDKLHKNVEFTVPVTEKKNPEKVKGALFAATTMKVQKNATTTTPNANAGIARSQKRTASSTSSLLPTKKQKTHQKQHSLLKPSDPVNKKDEQNSKHPNKKQQHKESKLTLEPVPFDEERFKAIISLENVKKFAKKLKTLVKEEVAKKKNTIFTDFTYILNINCFKIPNVPKRMVKLSLKHSLVDEENDVVIIVADLNRGSKIDYEPTIEHYEELFRGAGVRKLKIMPFNQFKKECNSYEAVRKFSNTYDYFLCDGRIAGHVHGLVGKVMQKPRKTFFAVRMQNVNWIKDEIEKSLCRTAFRQYAKGDLISIPVGNHKYTMQKLAENVNSILAQIETFYPGGAANVRGIRLKIDIVGTSSLPIYLSMLQPPETTPYVVGQREERMIKIKKEANKVLTKFAITKNAQVVKLSDEQKERKRKISEVQAALAKNNGDEDDEPKDNDGEDSAVPAKKSKKEETAEVEKVLKKKSNDEKPTNVAQSDDDDSDVDDVDDDDDDDDGDADDDNDIDDDDDDDEGDGDGDGDVDDDDDENSDVDSDADADDDDDENDNDDDDDDEAGDDDDGADDDSE